MQSAHENEKLGAQLTTITLRESRGDEKRGNTLRPHDSPRNIKLGAQHPPLSTIKAHLLELPWRTKGSQVHFWLQIAKDLAGHGPWGLPRGRAPRHSNALGAWATVDPSLMSRKFASAQL